MTKTKADVVETETVEKTSDVTDQTTFAVEPAPEDLKAFLIDLYSLELSMREQGHSLFHLFAKGAHDAYGIAPVVTILDTDGETLPVVYTEAKQNPANKV
jgi:hypothetical protein